MNIKKSTKVILITGPTSVGKNRLLHKLAQKKDIIFNFDSQQFYRTINIGTAKPSNYYLKKFNYNLINFLDLKEPYSCFHFLKDLEQKIKGKHAWNKKIFLIGGSPLYQKVITQGLSDELEIDPQIKQTLQNDYHNKGATSLLQELKSKDLNYYQEVDQKNPRRILRALEVIRSGQKFSTYRNKLRKLNLNIFKVILLAPRKILYTNIDNNIEKMFEKGWLEEVKKIIQKVDQETFSKIKAIGYQEIKNYLLKKNQELEKLKENIKQKTKKYAKQQLTWFKKESSDFIFFPFQIKKNIINNHLDKWIEERYRKNPTNFIFNYNEFKKKINYFYQT